jgi:hypothetical protein
MPRFLVVRVNKDSYDTYAVPYHGHAGESVFDALDIALPDEGSRIDYAVVDAGNASAARFTPRAADWESLPPRWIHGWRHDMPDVAQLGAATKSKLTDKISIEDLAKLLGLPDWDKIDEMNQFYYMESAQGAGDEDAQIEAERVAQTEVFNKWYDAVESVAEKLLEQHGLGLLAMRHTRKVNRDYRPFYLKIIPSTSWSDAADKIRDTINGVGYFHFNNLREFLDSGPYTARQAVLTHLGYVKSYPAVYGTTSTHSLYEHAWRD